MELLALNGSGPKNTLFWVVSEKIFSFWHWGGLFSGTAALHQFRAWLY
jgi:hypothetical protein